MFGRNLSGPVDKLPRRIGEQRAKTSITDVFQEQASDFHQLFSE
jgi:hypothetical protein